MFGIRAFSRIPAVPSTACRITFARCYAISRFPGRGRPVGSGRRQLSPPSSTTERQKPSEDQPEDRSSTNESPLWNTGKDLDASGSSEGLQRLLANDLLVVERQIEMLNIFIGFEQTNKYSISNGAGEQVGYIAEESGGFLSQFNRQIMATHRPFRALVMDPTGAPILWVRRPFAWINSRMYVQRPSPEQSPSSDEAVLDTFSEVQQVWHPIRRRYDLFMRETPKRILSLASDPQPEPEPDPETFSQIGKVDAGFLAWDFSIKNAAEQEMAFISRNFRGFGREIFTDTGQYVLNFGPRPQQDGEGNPLLDPAGNMLYTAGTLPLSLEERALVMALAVNIDFTYFSRKSGSGPGFFHIPFGGDW